MMIKVQLYSDEGVLIQEHSTQFTQGIQWQTNEPIREENVVCWGYELVPDVQIIEDAEEIYDE